MNRTYKYRLYPNKTQAKQLDHIFSIAWRVYNDIHHMRKVGYFENGVKWSWQDLAKFWRRERNRYPDLQLLPSDTVTELVKRHDKALKAFFTRRKDGVGYPKEKKRIDFRGLEYWYGKGVKLSTDEREVTYLYLMNVGTIKVRLHRPLPDSAKAKLFIVGKSRRDQWFVCVQVEMPDAEPLPHCGDMVGIDLGIAHLLALSNGVLVENPRWYKESQRKRRAIGRKLDRQRRASNPQNYNENGTVKENAVIWRKSNRLRDTEKQLRRLEEHIAQQRWYFWHTLTDQLTKQYGLIALEDLTLDFMIKNRRLAMPAHDAAFSMFWQMLRYKAEERGVTLVFVPPQYTSQTCAECGHVSADNRRAQANFTCVACGHQNNADLNAARNILNLAVQASVQDVRGVTQTSRSYVPRDAQNGTALARHAAP